MCSVTNEHYWSNDRFRNSENAHRFGKKVRSRCVSRDEKCPRNRGVDPWLLTSTNNHAWKKSPFVCNEACSARNSSTSERGTIPSSAAFERDPAIARRKNSCGVDMAKVSILMFLRPACLASAGNSRAKLWFGIDAATMEVILRVKAWFVE